MRTRPDHETGAGGETESRFAALGTDDRPLVIVYTTCFGIFSSSTMT